MSKAEILSELPRLSPADLAEVQAKLDELAANAWLELSGLSGAEKNMLDAALADYEANPAAGDTWENVKARIESKLAPRSERSG